MKSAKYTMHSNGWILGLVATVLFIASCNSGARSGNEVGLEIKPAPGLSVDSAATDGPTSKISALANPKPTKLDGVQTQNYFGRKLPDAFLFGQSMKNAELYDMSIRGAGEPFALRGLFEQVRDSAEQARKPDEQLLILERLADEGRQALAHSPDARARCGTIITTIPGQIVPVEIPLVHTAVDARITGLISRVSVTQQFKNPFDSKIEAIYVFPLPHDAAVDGFVMTIGDRKIRGIIREKEEAQRIYQAARAQGYNASLLTQARPNIFEQKVANIEPGKSIDIEIQYLGTVPYRDGAFEWVFPMVVGPRYNPLGTEPNGIGAVPRGPIGQSGHQTETQFLRPEQRSGHDIAVKIRLDAGVDIEQLSSPSHAIKVDRHNPSSATIELAEHDRIPNKDLVLRYQVAKDQVQSSFITHRDADGNGFFALTLFPPEDPKKLAIQGCEFIFVLDCSGSMRGKPLNLAKDATRRLLQSLSSKDSFQIIRFASNATAFRAKPVAATGKNIRAGLAYLDQLNSGGGTEMIHGIRAALNYPQDSERQRIVSFMTDGYIGNETDIFSAIHSNLGDSRIFSFGVGSSTNRHLLAGMARIGRGAVAYVGLDEGVARHADQFYLRARRPALSNVEFDFGGMQVSELSCERNPDLFAGRPLIITGRFQGAAENITIRSKQGNIHVKNIALEDRPELAKIWARGQIQKISDQATISPENNSAERIQSLALMYGIMSSYTSFVAVDSSQKTSGDHGHSVAVPTPVPYGVKYSTSVNKTQNGN